MNNKITKSQDFFVENNHARLSVRKVAEIIGVSHVAILKKIGNLFDDKITETITEKGIDGGNLNQIIGYYTSAKEQVKLLEHIERIEDEKALLESENHQLSFC